MKPIKFLGFFLLIAMQSFAQEDSVLKSLGYYEAYDNPTQADTVLVYQIGEVYKVEMYNNPQKAHLHAYAVYDISKKLNFKKGIADGLHFISEAKMLLNQKDAAMDFADKAIAYAKQNKLLKAELNAYVTKGNCFFYLGQHDQSAEQYFKASEIAEQHFEEELAGCYSALGNSFRASGQDEKAQEYLTKSLKYSKIQKDTANMLFTLNNLGIVTKNLGDLEKSLEFYSEGLEIAENTGNKRREGEFVYNMANVYFNLKQDEKGFEMLDRSAEITALIGNNRDMALENYNIGYWHGQFGNNRAAIQYSKKAIEFAEKAGYIEVLEASSGVLADMYAEIGNYEEAYKWNKTQAFWTDSSKKLTDQNAMIEMENQFELEKIAFQDSLNRQKDQLEFEHKQKLSKEKVKSRESLLWLAGGIIFIVILGIIQLFRSNKKVKSKNEIITLQKDEIEETHKEITDSINYAQRIQNALISGNEEWDKISQQHFIYFQPKDVVSGDFYWAYHSEEENLSIWATADCTGHGVPGAFMSMLGIGFLNEIIIENDHRKGGEILDLLRAKIIKALAQKGGDQMQKDGMDMALCIWDKKNNTLEFTGANNPLYIIRKTADVDLDQYEKYISHPNNGFTLIELRSNKMPVGFQSDVQEHFKSEKFQLKEGDFIVSFTDGYADQFGGLKGKKLKYKPFKETLLEQINTPVKLRGTELEDKFLSWKGELEQVDDVCVIGVKV